MQTQSAIVNQGRVGRYQLVRRIAVGGMAEVFEATDEAGTSPVVVKILLPHLCQDSDALQMFDDEAQLTKGLAHHNLVRTLDTGQSDGRPYLVMELVDGCTLNELLRRTGPVSVPLAGRITHEMLRGLHYLHGYTDDAGHTLHIVHRDVNPRNVLLSRDGKVKLADFGIARWRLRAARTRNGVIKGTVQYMSPEQITGSEPDQRADLYGVGLVMFEMLTGHPYIEAENEMALLRLAENPPWRPASSTGANLPEAIDNLLRPALMQFPEQRYRSAEKFIDSLEQTMADIDAPRAEAASLGQRVCRTVENRDLAASASPLPAEKPTPALQRHNTIPSDKAALGMSLAPKAMTRRWVMWAALGGVLFAAIRVASWAWRSWDRASVFPSGTKSSRTMQTSTRTEQPVLQETNHATPPSTNAKSAKPAPTARSTTPSIGLSRRTQRARNVRSKARRSAKAPPEARAKVAAAPTPDAREARDALAQLRLVMRSKGIVTSDFSQAQRTDLSLAREQIHRGDTTDALKLIVQLKSAVAAIEINRAFVQLKLARVDRRLKSLPQNRADVQRLRQQSTEALQAFMDGNYAQANRQLNQIERETRTE